MEQMSVSSLTALFPETKSQIEVFVDKMVSDALEGYISPLKTDAQLACMENVVKSIRANKEFKDALLSEAEKENTKTFTHYNAQFQIKEVGTKWHYENCGHEQYERICAQIDELTEQKKAFEKFMQAQKKEFEHLDSETGSVYTVKPPYKTSTTQVVTTINK